MFARLIRGVALLGALLLLAGCYETEAPVIEAGDGVEIPDFAGTYQASDDGDLVIEDRTEGLVLKDYKYYLRGSDGVEYDVLAAKLADQLWHLQMARQRTDGSTTYLHMFLARENDVYSFKIPDLEGEEKTVENVSQELGVKVEGGLIKRDGVDEMRNLLTGPPDAIKAFIKAHADRVKLNPLMPLMRK